MWTIVIVVLTLLVFSAILIGQLAKTLEECVLDYDDWEELDKALEEGHQEFALVGAAEVIDKHGVEWFLESVMDKCESPVEQQKIYEMLGWAEGHTFGEGVEL